MEKITNQNLVELVETTNPENQHVKMVKDICLAIGICTVTAAGVYMTYNGAKYDVKKQKATYTNDVVKMCLEGGKVVVTTGIDMYIKLK